MRATRKKGPMADVWRRLKKNKFAMASLFVIIALILIAAFAPFLIPYDYAEQDYNSIKLGLSSEHLMGTDNFGRDIFSRIIYGSRYTVFIGFICITGAAVGGIILGLIAGYYPKLDGPIMRTIDIIIGMPAMTLLMCLIAVMGVSMRNMCIALIVTHIPSFARVTRAQVMTLKNQEFVEASVALGASNRRILLKHILPNCLAPNIIEYTLGCGGVVLWSASLSFIGMGVQSPTPEWGLMISEGRQYLRDAPHMAIIPGLCIVLFTFVLNYLGDGLRDAMDPRLNK